MFEGFFRNRNLDESQGYYKALRAYELDAKQDFARLTGRIGLLPAINYAQLFFTNLNTHKRLRRELELHQRESNSLNRDYDVLLVMPPRGLVPGAHYKRFLRQAMGLATSGEFALVSQAQLNTERVLSGAKRLFEIIAQKRRERRKVLLVSYSFGSAFVRVMLDQMTDLERKPIRGWLNVSGLIAGTPRFHCSDRRSFFDSMTLGQRSFSSEQRYFRGEFDTYGIKTIHALGLRNSNLSERDIRQREYLKAWGPNDGLLPYSHYQRLSQPVLPLLDQGHWVDLASMSSSYLRALSSMVSLVPSQPRGTLQDLDFV